MPKDKNPDSDIHEETYQVYDLNAHGPEPRVHEVNGHNYSLSAFEPTDVPLTDAICFLKDPAFRVMDGKGKQIQLAPEPEKGGDIKLQPHQTVANFTELTAQALIERAKRFPGGEKASPGWGKSRLAEFVMEQTALSMMDDEPAPVIEGEEGDPVIEDAADDEAWVKDALPSREQLAPQAGF